MALRSLGITTMTVQAFADAANYTDTTYLAIQGGTATQRVRIEDIYMGGQAGAAAPITMLLSRDSTVGATLSKGSGCTDVWLDPSSADFVANPVGFNTATTKPQRSTTLHLLNLSFNAFGGLIRYGLAPNERELALLGNTASLGELSLSSFSGTAAVGAHIVYEPF
jgi:hypothetical protein